MSALSELLNRVIDAEFPGLSNRTLATKAGVSRGTVDNYRNGSVVHPTEDVLQAFHKLLNIPIQELREAAGLPRGETAAYAPPIEANLLDDRQRKAVDEIIRVIVASRGMRNAVEATAKSNASGQAIKGKKMTASDKADPVAAARAAVANTIGAATAESLKDGDDGSEVG